MGNAEAYRRHGDRKIFYSKSWQWAAHLLSHDYDPMRLDDEGNHEEANRLRLFLGTLQDQPRNEQKFHDWVDRIRAEREQSTGLIYSANGEQNGSEPRNTEASVEEKPLRQMRLFK